MAIAKDARGREKVTAPQKNTTSKKASNASSPTSTATKTMREEAQSATRPVTRSSGTNAAAESAKKIPTGGTTLVPYEVNEAQRNPEGDRQLADYYARTANALNNGEEWEANTKYNNSSSKYSDEANDWGKATPEGIVKPGTNGKTDLETGRELAQLDEDPIIRSAVAEGWETNPFVDKAAESWVQEREAGTLGAVGALLQSAGQLGTGEREQAAKAELAEIFGPGTYTPVDVIDPASNIIGRAGQSLLGTAQNLQAEGNQNWNEATQNLGPVGKTVATIAKTGMDVVADIAENSILPGLGTMRMYLGAGGHEALNQSGREANDPDSLAIAAVKGSANAWLSNKLIGGLDAAYGESVLGKALKEQLQNASPIVRTLVNTEGFEEGLEDILNYAGDRILGLEQNEGIQWDEVATDAFVGYVLGVLTNGLSAGIEYNAAKRHNLTDEGIDFALSGATPDQAAQIAMQSTQDQVVMKPGTGTGTGDVTTEAAPQTAEDIVQEYRQNNPAPQIVQTPAPIVTPEAKTQAQQSVIDILMSPNGENGQLSNRQVQAIAGDTALLNAFQELTGKLPDGTTASEQRASAKQIAANYIAGLQANADAKSRAKTNIEIDDIIDEVMDWSAEQDIPEDTARRLDDLQAALLSIQEQAAAAPKQTEPEAKPEQKAQAPAEEVANRKPKYGEPGWVNPMGEDVEETGTQGNTNRTPLSQQDIIDILSDPSLSFADLEETQDATEPRRAPRSEQDIISILGDPTLSFAELEETQGNTSEPETNASPEDISERRARQIQLLQIYTSNIINLARTAGVDLRPFYRANPDFDYPTVTRADADDLARSLGPIVSALDSKGYTRAYDYLNAIWDLDIPDMNSATPEAQNDSTANAEVEQVNTSPEEESANTAGLTGVEAEADQNANQNANQNAEEQQQNTTNEQGEQQEPKARRRSVNNNGNPDENTEALFNSLNQQYGSIEPGENPAREINVPKKDTGNRNVGRGARTIFEAEATPESRLGNLKAAVVNGQLGYVPVTNDARSTNAARSIAKNGWKKSVGDFLGAVNSGKVDADTIALGAHLLNEAGNSPEATGRDYVELVMAYNDAAHQTGQALAAARILKTLTPAGKLYGIEKTVERINKGIQQTNAKKKVGKPKAEVKLDEQLAEKYLTAKTEQERNDVHDEIVKDIARQVPNTLRDKFTALRYLNMLGNFKTQIRNVFGNVAMTATQKVKNEVRSFIEGIAAAASDGKYERQYKNFYGTDLYKVARADFGSDEALRDAAMGEAKYSDVGKQAESEINKTKKPFSDRNPLGKFLNLYSKATNAAMEFGDLVFVRANYADALAGYLNAHGITAAEWTAMVGDPDKASEVDKARNIAIKQAQEATFRDTNSVSKFVSTMDSRWPKLMKAISQGVIPFRKTPANVLVRMEEYSPLGFVNTALNTYKAATGEGNASAAIDSFAKSLTGSALTALGYWLRSRGQARTKDKDDKEEKLAKLRGQQDYSIEFTLPNGERKSFTLDWLTPDSGAFFMGVELFNLIDDGGITPAEALTVLSSFTNPMLEMSMLSGVNDALSNLSDFEGDNSAMAQFILNSAWSYLTQGITNTLLGQAEQFNEDYRQTYFTDADNPLFTTSMQKKLAKLGNKTPGIDYQAADYIDAWGRKQESEENPFIRALNVFANPGYVSDVSDKATEADDIVNMLYEFGQKQTKTDSFPNVVPQTPSRNTTVNGTKLTPEEYDVYATAKGQEALDAVIEFSESDLYKKMNNYDRAETISDIYSYSLFLAASKIAEMRGEDYYDDTYSPLITGKTESGESTYKTPIKEEDIPEYLAFKNAYDSAVNDKKYNVIDALLDSSNKLPKSAREGVLEHAQQMGTLTELKEAGLSSSKSYYRFQDDIKNVYESEKRSAPKSSDYIRVAGSGKYSDRDADAIMNYETSVSEKTLARYQEQVKYNLEQAGMSGSYNEVWSKVQAAADGGMTSDQLKTWVEKNVPLQYQKAIRDVASNYSEDRHVAGKTVSGIYRAVRSAGFTPEQALEFYNMIDTNYNGSFTKKELDAACRTAFGSGDTSKQIRALLKEYIGK